MLWVHPLGPPSRSMSRSAPPWRWLSGARWRLRPGPAVGATDGQRTPLGCERKARPRPSAGSLAHTVGRPGRLWARRPGSEAAHSLGPGWGGLHSRWASLPGSSGSAAALNSTWRRRRQHFSFLLAFPFCQLSCGFDEVLFDFSCVFFLIVDEAAA